ncbi:hypothetical protein KUTeg_019240 [Tegillarca granosa]|uniref:MATH domain-containing protein n=1 Tax=Tegillarca granosa TaxID=220873 RepID=A0ABQ9EBY3_TEGGR|nr:hypothetical protein KUTeg_019240 [Tegillarca granosa]
MAKLYRLVKLNDRFSTQVFTFLLPNKILREFSPDVYAKDFVYGFQKWTVSFIKSDKHLGAYLKLQTTSADAVCKVDYSFTMINREHFTKNETFIEKNFIFNKQTNVTGRKTFVPLEDLATRTFMQENGEFLVELELRNIVTTLECYLSIPKEYHSKYAYGPKMESPYFTFGLFDWSISLYPNACTAETEGNVAVQLHRHTSFDHMCDVRYQITLGEKNLFESGTLEQLLDTTGNGEPYVVGCPLHILSRGRATLKVKVDMYNVVSVSELNDPESGYLSPDDQKLVVQLEWIDSQLLICPSYHSLDDVTRLHKQQMMREILALQAENEALEKQIHSYQVSISKTNSKSVSEDEGMRRSKSPRRRSHREH